MESVFLSTTFFLISLGNFRDSTVVVFLLVALFLHLVDIRRTRSTLKYIELLLLIILVTWFRWLNNMCRNSALRACAHTSRDAMLVWSYTTCLINYYTITIVIDMLHNFLFRDYV